MSGNDAKNNADGLRRGLSLGAASLSLGVAGASLWLGLSVNYTAVRFTLIGLGGVIGVLAAPALGWIAMTNLGLYDKKKALGLPAGSIRAVIAAGLIALFVIFTIYYFQVIANPTHILRGITQAQLGNIAADQIITSYPDPNGTYTVVLQGSSNQASTDIAKQVLTTLSTLVVAVSAFYFGTKAPPTQTKPPPAAKT